MKNCPCKRVKCPRYGDCESCRKYHENHPYEAACEQKSGGKRRRFTEDLSDASHPGTDR